MIGNDVVDLELARRESNWKRRGFMEKIFTLKEREIILKSDNPETCLWILWSMKEAAYKVYNRQTGIRAFIPHKLECSIISLSRHKAEGIVKCGTNTYFTQTEILEEIIHTVAVESAKATAKICKINADLVQKDEFGRPFIYDISGSMKPVSKSHHGRCETIVGFT